MNPNAHTKERTEAVCCSVMDLGKLQTVIILHLYVPEFERKKKSNGNDVFADNSVGWHLATNPFHQHVRLLMEISPNTFF